MSFSTPADAVGFAVRYASRSGARVWVQRVNNQYEAVDGGTTTLAEAN